MPILTVNFLKYEPRMKLLQIGPAENDFQSMKTIRDMFLREN